jgi:hypothetical protein
MYRKVTTEGTKMMIRGTRIVPILNPLQPLVRSLAKDLIATVASIKGPLALIIVVQDQREGRGKIILPKPTLLVAIDGQSEEQNRPFLGAISVMNIESTVEMKYFLAHTRAEQEQPAVVPRKRRNVPFLRMEICNL